MADDEWPFSEPPNLAVLTTTEVIRDGGPVLSVWHDGDGDWQFLGARGATAAEDAQIVSLGGLIARDPSLRPLADLPPGWSARRSAPGGPWRRDKSE